MQKDCEEIMITNEAETRVALQAILVGLLAVYGFWGCALVMFLILLPWKPILAVGGYLAQPVVDWCSRKSRKRRGKGVAQIEQELDAFLAKPKGGLTATPTAPPEAGASTAPPKSKASRLLKPLKPAVGDKPSSQEPGLQAEELPSTLATPPAIRERIRNLLQPDFGDMRLEVEQVKLHGDTADAYVKFQSPSAKELAIHQHYVLKKSHGQWEVASSQPSNGESKFKAQGVEKGIPQGL
jgi:hypothetical protein